MVDVSTGMTALSFHFTIPVQREKLGGRRLSMSLSKSDCFRFLGVTEKQVLTPAIKVTQLLTGEDEAHASLAGTLA